MSKKKSGLTCGGGCEERLENILADEKCFKILSQIPKTAFLKALSNTVILISIFSTPWLPEYGIEREFSVFFLVLKGEAETVYYIIIIL